MPSFPQVLPMTSPIEVRSFPFGQFELFTVGDHQLGRAMYRPGWRWSRHVAPIAGTPLCQIEHSGVVLGGHAAVLMDNGSQLTMGPHDLFSIPPGHDSWVVGDEDYVSLHFLGANSYARQVPDRHSQPVSDGLSPVSDGLSPVSTRNAPCFTWREVCKGWTLLSRPALHVLQELMPPGTVELKHLHPATAQFYYVLCGEATVGLDDSTVTARAGEGIEIPPGVAHQMRNESGESLEFLVASSQPPRGDRVDVQEP